MSAVMLVLVDLLVFLIFTVRHCPLVRTAQPVKTGYSNRFLSFELVETTLNQLHQVLRRRLVTTDSAPQLSKPHSCCWARKVARGSGRV